MTVESVGQKQEVYFHDGVKLLPPALQVRGLHRRHFQTHLPEPLPDNTWHHRTVDSQNPLRRELKHINMMGKLMSGSVEISS